MKKYVGNMKEYLISTPFPKVVFFEPLRPLLPPLEIGTWKIFKDFSTEYDRFFACQKYSSGTRKNSELSPVIKALGHICLYKGRGLKTLLFSTASSGGQLEFLPNLTSSTREKDLKFFQVPEPIYRRIARHFSKYHDLGLYIRRELGIF